MLQTGRKLGEEHFERHRTVVLQIVGKEDSRHPAPPQLALEAERTRFPSRKRPDWPRAPADADGGSCRTW